jgi:hypothetical protein
MKVKVEEYSYKLDIADRKLKKIIRPIFKRLQKEEAIFIHGYIENAHKYGDVEFTNGDYSIIKLDKNLFIEALSIDKRI